MNRLLKSRLLRLSLPICLFALGLGSGAAAAQSSAAGSQMDKIMPQPYLCTDHNVRLPVTYIETGGGNAYVVMQVEGKLISMARRQVAPASPDVSAAGEAAAPAAPAAPVYYYLSLDPQNSYRWYPRGDGAQLKFQPADGSNQEAVVYASCQAMRKGE